MITNDALACDVPIDAKDFGRHAYATAIVLSLLVTGYAIWRNKKECLLDLVGGVITSR